MNDEVRSLTEAVVVYSKMRLRKTTYTSCRTVVNAA